MAYNYGGSPIYCTTCGREADPGARYCDNCGARLDPMGRGGPQYAPGMPYQRGPGYGEAPHIDNYLVWAILATICCCVPSGIVAIVYAAQVNGRVAAGDYAEAQRFSNNAKTWCLISLGLGITMGIIYGLAGIFGSFSGAWWGV